MNEQFTRQAQEMFAAAQSAKIPENVQVMAEETVAKTREAYVKMNAVAKDGAKAMEEVMLTAQAGARSIGEKVLHNTAVNTEKVFDAAQAMARARSFPEFMSLQTNFFQQQMSVAGVQTRELFELSSKVAKQTLETLNDATTKSFEQVKKAG